MNIDHGNELKKGVESFNAWRKANPSIIPDLSSANLSRANLRNANLRNANLRNANLSYTDLRWTILIGADLSNADLHGADLNYDELSPAQLKNATFSPSNFRYVAKSGNVEIGNVKYTEETESPYSIESKKGIIRLVNMTVLTWFFRVYAAVPAFLAIVLMFGAFIYIPFFLLTILWIVISGAFFLLGIDVPSWLSAIFKVLFTWPLHKWFALRDLLTPPEFVQDIILLIAAISVFVFEVIGSIATRSWLRLSLVIGLMVFYCYILA